MENTELRVLFDGWTVVREANSPAALHLLELLEPVSACCRAYLALPQEPEETLALPANVKPVVASMAPGARARLQWEQRQLSQLAGQVEADLLHLTTPTAGLFGRLPVVVSPAGGTFQGAPARRGLAARFREALGMGGMCRASAVFWPEGLPAPDLPGPLFRLPGLVSPDFNPTDPPDQTALRSLDLPETYLLYHGPQDDHSLQRITAIWSWAAGSIGELFPLVVLGFTEPQRRQAFIETAASHDLERYMSLLPPVPLQVVPSVYRGAAGLLHLGPVSAWGGPVRYALACGKPVIAEQDALAEALVGPAGYLFSEQDARKMGAALLTVVVNEDVANNLRKAALAQAAGWHMETFQERLKEAYRQVMSK